MFKYRAVSVEDKSTVEFSLKDGPSLIYDKKFILSAKEDTPILYTSSISRGSSELDIYEGDTIYDADTDELLGIVTFYNGFKVTKNFLDYSTIPDVKHIIVKDRVSLSKLRRTPIMFKNTIEFNIGNIVYVDKDTIYLQIDKYYYKYSLFSIKEAVGELDGKLIYSGDVLNGVIINENNIYKGV